MLPPPPPKKTVQATTLNNGLLPPPPPKKKESTSGPLGENGEPLSTVTDENSPSIYNIKPWESEPIPGTEEYVSQTKDVKKWEAKFNKSKQALKDVEDKVKTINSRLEDLGRYLMDTRQINSKGEILKIEDRDYFEEYSKLSDEKNALIGDYNRARTNTLLTRDGYVKELNAKMVEDYWRRYRKEAEKGNFGGFLYNKLVSGYGSAIAGGTQVMWDVTDMIMGPPNKVEQDARAVIREGIKNKTFEPVEKSWAYEKASTGGIGRGSMYMAGTTPEYEKELEKRSWWSKAAGGVAQSIPAMATPMMAGIFLQAYETIDTELRSVEEFNEVPEYQKVLLKSSVGIVSAALERIGFKALTGKAVGITANVLRGIEGKISAKAIEKATSTFAGRYGKQLLYGAITEGETGFMQELATTGLKDLFTTVKGLEEKGAFDTPDFSNPDGSITKKSIATGIGQYLGQAWEAGKLEAAGGLMMGAVLSISPSISGPGPVQFDADQFEIFESLVDGSLTSEDLAARIDLEVANGTITAEQGAKAMEGWSDMQDAVMALPEGMTMEQRKKAVELILEKKKITARIEGKEGALVEDDKARLEEIENELKNVKNIKQDATQQQDRTVRPEGTETGQEQGQRDSDMPEVNRTVVQDRQAAQEEIDRLYQSFTENWTDRRVELVQQGMDPTEAHDAAFDEFLQTEQGKRLEELQSQVQIESELDSMMPGEQVAEEDIEEGLTDIERSKVVLQDEAQRAEAVLPKGITITVHPDSKSFTDATGKNGGGAFIDGTIHINPEAANRRTVAHEVFHAILADKLKTDKNIQDATRQMVESLRDSESITPDMRQELDNFINNYDDNVRNEEFLAELVGYMVDNNMTLQPKQRNIIKRWLDKLAKLFGFKKGFTEAETAQILNSIATGISTGVAIPNRQLRRLARKGQKTSTSRESQAVNTITGYARTQSQVRGVVARALERGWTRDQTFDNAFEFLKKSTVWSRADAGQKVRLERQLRDYVNKAEKLSPNIASLFKALGKTITTADKNAIREKIKDLARGARDSIQASNAIRKKLNGQIAELRTKGKISVYQAAAMLGKLNTLNTFDEISVDNFVDYIGKVFNNAEFAQRVANIKNRQARAKRAIKSKLGVIKGDLARAITGIVNSDVANVPDNMLDKFESIVNMLAQNKTELTLPERAELIRDSMDVWQAINDSNSEMANLYDIFEAYEDKSMKDGKVDFEATLESMVNKGLIEQADADRMLANKNRFLAWYRESMKPKKTDAELRVEQEQDKIDRKAMALDIKNNLRNHPIDPSKIGDRASRDAARMLAKAIRDSRNLDRLTKRELGLLMSAIDNINKGTFSANSEVLLESINAINRSQVLASVAKTARPTNVAHAIASIKKFMLSRRNVTAETIKAEGLMYIDRAFGNFESRQTFQSSLEETSKAYGQYETEMKEIANKMATLKEKLLKDYRYRPNDALAASYNITSYLLENEFVNNPGSKTELSFKEFIKRTINKTKANDTTYTTLDSDVLQGIMDNVEANYTNADGTVDLAKWYDSFSQTEKNIIKAVGEINENLRDKALFTSYVLRGNGITPVIGYLHHHVIDTSATAQGNDASIANSAGTRYQPSTKAKNMESRTDGAKAINFDIFSSVTRGANMILMDYHMTRPIRTARKTIKRTEELLSADEQAKAMDYFNGIKLVLDEVVKNFVEVHAVEHSSVYKAIKLATKRGIQYMLAAPTRVFGSEAPSNLMSIIADPKAAKAGYRFMRSEKADYETMYQVAKNAKAANLSRMFPQGDMSSRFIDAHTLEDYSGISANKMNSKTKEFLKMMYHFTGGRAASKHGSHVADKWISLTDLLSMHTMFFGRFLNQFKEITGAELDIDKMKANDEAYIAQNEDAIEQAVRSADELSTYVGATNNPFMGILRGAKNPRHSAIEQLFNVANNFMTTFRIFEFSTAKDGVYKLMANNKMTRKEGARLLTMVAARMTVYTITRHLVLNSIAALLGIGSDDDEEKGIEKSVMQSIVSTVAYLMLGRNFGNVVSNLVGSGVEYLNKETLDFLRDGEYNYYNDKIMNGSFAPGEAFNGDDFLNMFAGPLSPFLDTSLDAVDAYSKAYDESSKDITKAHYKTRAMIESAKLLSLMLYSVPGLKDLEFVVDKEVKKMYEEAKAAEKPSKGSPSGASPYSSGKTTKSKSKGGSPY